MRWSCLARLAAACRPVVLLVLINATLAAAAPREDGAQRTAESRRSGAAISGTVVDPLGAIVTQAAVILVRDDGQKIADTSSGARGWKPAARTSMR